MREFHKDKKRYFDMQYRTTKEYIIPYISDVVNLDMPIDVLEIGCAEAGVLKAFTESGHRTFGIELSEGRVKLAKEFLAKELSSGQFRIINKNIYDINIDDDIGNKFDLVILKDVIEHIHNQEKFMAKVADFLKPDGKIFFGFPPWMMPFGGHQQVCKSKFLSYLPYYHMLPMPIYKSILKLGGESPTTVEALVEIKETGISIERFNRILRKEAFKVEKHDLFLTNPIYKYKFGLKVRRQLKLIQGLPWIRNFVSTCAYYLISKRGIN